MHKKNSKSPRNIEEVLEWLQRIGPRGRTARASTQGTKLLIGSQNSKRGVMWGYRPQNRRYPSELRRIIPRGFSKSELQRQCSQSPLEAPSSQQSPRSNPCKAVFNSSSQTPSPKKFLFPNSTVDVFDTLLSFSWSSEGRCFNEFAWIGLNAKVFTRSR